MGKTPLVCGPSPWYGFIGLTDYFMMMPKLMDSTASLMLL